MIQKVDKKKLKIAYLLPGAIHSASGGVAVVLQHVNRLKQRGYQVYVIVLHGDHHVSWFKRNHVEVVGMDFFGKSFKGVDILVATHWYTADVVAKSAAKRKVYFVQSDERRFVINEENLRKVEDTYKFEIEYMTEAKWIQRWLSEEFGHDAYYVPNGLDQEIFHKAEPLEKRGNKIRVLIEGPIDSHFKGVKDAYNAVDGLDVELWIVSSFGSPPKEWHYDKFLSNVPIEKMKNVYSACDILLKMSRVEGFFGPPMEAMNCGCAVIVSKCTGYDEYIIDGKNALVVEKGDVEASRNAIKKLINNPDLRENLVKNGYQTAKDWNWDKSIDLLEKMINGEKPERFYTKDKPEIYDYKREMIDVRYQVTIAEYAIKQFTEDFFLKSYLSVNKALRKMGREAIKLWNSIKQGYRSQ